MRPNDGIGDLVRPVGGRNHVRGPAAAPVTLVEYGDYECPPCGAAHPVVGELRRRLGDRLRFAFRHFPLAGIHPHATDAAEAAEAAGAQGAFWEMHDRLYRRQDRLEPEDLVGLADALGLDPGRFARDLETRAHAARVRADVASGERSGVEGTPTFFVNGRRHTGPHDARTLAAALDEDLETRTGHHAL